MLEAGAFFLAIARGVHTSGRKCVSMATYVAVKTIPKKKISDPKTVKDEPLGDDVG